MTDAEISQRRIPSPTTPVIAVYFTGMIDVISVDELAIHTWHIASAGPFTSIADITAANRALVLDRLTGEPIFEQSPGWRIAQFEHEFTPGADDERYCDTMVADLPGSPAMRCAEHAKYHKYAPEHLRKAPAVVYRSCVADLVTETSSHRCSEVAAMIVGNRPYCAPCGALASLTDPQATS